MAVLFAPSKSPIVDMAARGGRGSPRAVTGLLAPSVPKLEGASVSRGASLGGIEGKGGGGNAAAVGCEPVAAAGRGSAAVRGVAVLGFVAGVTAGMGAVVVTTPVAGAAGAGAGVGAAGATFVSAGLRWLRTGGGGGPDELRTCGAAGPDVAEGEGPSDGAAGRRTGGGGGFEE